MHTTELDFNLIPQKLDDASPGEAALLAVRVLWPTFQEVEGVVLLEGMIESARDRERLGASIDRLEGDLASVEKEFNFYEIDLLFGKLVSDLTDDEVVWLARRLAAIWQARLRSQFPGLEFVVQSVEPAPVDGFELGITFYRC